MRNMFVETVFLLLLFFLPLTQAAHYITGRVTPLAGAESANGKQVVLWNPLGGINDNVTDIIGVAGNSGADLTYLIDCEMLSTACIVGDNLTVQIIDGSFRSRNVTGNVSGFGYDVFENLTLNSFPNVSSVVVDDGLIVPLGEIDLSANASTSVNCTAVLSDADGDITLVSATARFFSSSSSDGGSDDNNTHYTNSSCSISPGYGDGTEALASCFFEVWYYAVVGGWTCNVTVTDDLGSYSSGNGSTNINALLALDAPNRVTYTGAGPGHVSDELAFNISNYGNVPINLSLYGYAVTPSDNYSFNCSLGYNISIHYEKYNLTSSHPESLSLGQFEADYSNLTASAVVKSFGLLPRQDEGYHEAQQPTYWRAYVPVGALGDCSGHVVFSAVQGAGT